MLSVETGDRALLFKHLSRIYQLPSITEAAVRAFPNELEPDIYLEWLQPVSSAFSVMNLEAPWSSVKQHLNATKLKSLRFCSDRLSKLAPEPTVNMEQVDKLLTLVREVIDSVRDANHLPDHSRMFLMRHLDDVEAALIDYRFLGMRPLQRAFESTLGGVMLQQEVFESTKDDPAGRKAWDVFGRVAILCTISDTAQGHLEAAVPAIRALIAGS